MSDDITKHQEAIALICREVTEIKKAFSTAPEKLDTAELPAAYSLTSSATDSETTYGEKESDVKRVYRIQVAVLPIGQATPTLRETKCRSLLDKVRKQFKKHPLLKNVEFVQNATVLGDSGVVILPEFGMMFVGFEIRLQVEYTEIVDIDPLE